MLLYFFCQNDINKIQSYYKKANGHTYEWNMLANMIFSFVPNLDLPNFKDTG